MAGICVRLDGLPLALELAAARLKALSTKVLLERLDSRQALGMIGPRDLPARQQTLQQEIDWSHKLLTEHDKRFFRRLSVFAGGCTLTSSQTVCCLEKDGAALDVVEGLVSLVEKNLLVRRDEGGEPRYHMLQTIRDHAIERLDQSGEADEIHRRFVGYFLDLAERTEPEFYGSGGDPWLDRLELEHGNLLSTLSWLHEREDRLQGVRLAGAMGQFWVQRAHFVEGHHWLQLFHSCAEKTDPAAPRARIAFRLGQMKTAFEAEDYSGSAGILECFQESLKLWREKGNTIGIALSLSWMGYHCTCLSQEVRWASLEESVRLAREVGSPKLLAECITMAYAGRTSVDRGRAFKLAALEEAMELARKVGDPDLLCSTIHGMGDVFLYLGDYAAALPWFLEANKIARERDDKVLIHDNLFHLVTVYLAIGELPRAKAACLEALRLGADLNMRKYFPRLFNDMVEMAVKEGRMRRAARLRAVVAFIRKPDADFDSSAFGDLGLAEDAARAEWAAARSMTTGQAVAYALSDRE